MDYAAIVSKLDDVPTAVRKTHKFTFLVQVKLFGGGQPNMRSIQTRKETMSHITKPMYLQDRSSKYFDDDEEYYFNGYEMVPVDPKSPYFREV